MNEAQQPNENPASTHRQPVEASPSPIGSAHATHGDEVGLLRLATVVVTHWRMLTIVPLGAGMLAGLISMIVPSTYTGVSTFVPETRGQAKLGNGLGGLAGLASQFGVSVGSDPAESPRFYAKVAESRQILQQVLLTRFLRPRRGEQQRDSATLLDILRANGRDRADSIERGLKNLRRSLSVSVDNQTNIVRVAFDARDPELASAATNRIVGYLNDFNSQVRRSQAHERRMFVEDRVRVGEEDLRQAEQQLREFYDRNRSWQQSPQLVFQESRLRRQVDVREEVYLTLRREFETARIEEVNNVPLITIIDLAVPPVKRSWPKPVFLVIATVALAALASLIWVFMLEYLDRARRQDTDEYGHLRTVLAAARLDMRRFLGARSGRGGE